MADDANPAPEPNPPPAGVPADIPVVLPVPALPVPVEIDWQPRRRPPRAQPHFGWAVLWTLGFAVILFGTILGIVIGAAIVMAAEGEALQVGRGPGGEPVIPQSLVDVLAVSFPVAYLAGLLFTLLALWVVAGRGWTRQVGLRRPPLLHAFLVVVGLPGFVMASDGIARLLMGLFGSGGASNQEQMLKDVFVSFPWWFAVLAIGISPGVVEELWCRGFLGRGLVGRYGWPLGILLTSMFFGLLHMYPPWYVLVTATMGVGLHLVYLASRSLWVPILLHTLNNSLSALISIGTFPADRLERNAAAAPVLVPVLAAGLLAFVGVAMATGRVRVVPADPQLPAWEPPFPGVAHPPPGANAVLRTGPVSPVAVVLAVATCGILMYLLCR